MKKVFSVVKFVEALGKTDRDERFIVSILSQWALNCRGLTKEQMNDIGLGTEDAWMIEVEDDKEVL
jgi:hypothetical protein